MNPAKMMKATDVRVSTFEQNVSRQLKGKDGERSRYKIMEMIAYEN